LNSVQRIRGFTIVSAIFILVVLAALGAFIVNISTNQQIGSALDVQGERAYHAARAGVEWGVYKVQSSTLGVDNGYNFTYDCPASDFTTSASMCPNRRTCPASTTSFTFPSATNPTLKDFTVTVTCVATVDPGGYGGPTAYAVTATACNQPVSGWSATTVACPNVTNPNGFYIERRLEVAF
jgi:MSHA biogenesis protein MshP